MNSPMDRRVRSVASAQPQRSNTYYSRGPSPATKAAASATARVSPCSAVTVHGAVSVGATRSGSLRRQSQAARPSTASSVAAVAAPASLGLHQIHSALPATTFGKDVRDGMIPIPNSGKDYAISSKESVRYRVALQGGIGQPPPSSHFKNTCGSYGSNTVVSDENFFVATTFPRSQQARLGHYHSNQNSHTKNERGESRDGNGDNTYMYQRPKTADDALLLLNNLRMAEEDGGSSGGRRVRGTRYPHKVNRFAEYSSAHVYHNKLQSGNNSSNANTNASEAGFDSVLSFKPQFASTVPSSQVADASSTDTYLETHPRAAAVPADLVDYEKLLAPHIWQRKVQRQLRHQKAISAVEKFNQRGGRESSRSPTTNVTTNNSSAVYAGRGGVVYSSRSSSARSSSSFAAAEGAEEEEEGKRKDTEENPSSSSRSPTKMMRGGSGSFHSSLFQTTTRAADGSVRFGIVRDTAAAIEATACRSTRPKHFEKVVLDAATAKNEEKNNNKRKKTAATTTTISPHMHSVTTTVTPNNNSNNAQNELLLDTLRAQHERFSKERLGLTAVNSRQILSASSLAALGGGSFTSLSPRAQQQQTPQQTPRPGFGGEEALGAEYSSQTPVTNGYRHNLIGGNRRNDLARSALTGLLVTTFAGRGKGAGGHFGDGCCGSHPRGVVPPPPPPPPLPLNSSSLSSSSRFTPRGTDEDVLAVGFTYHAYDLSSTSAFAKASRRSEAAMLKCGERQPISFGRHSLEGNQNNVTNVHEREAVEGGGGGGKKREVADLVGVDVSVGAERRRCEGIARARGMKKAHVRVYGANTSIDEEDDDDSDLGPDEKLDGCRENGMKKGHQQQQKVDPNHPHQHAGGALAAALPLRPRPPRATSPRPSPEVTASSASVQLPPSSTPTISSPSFSSFVSKSHNAQLMRQQKRRAVVLGQSSIH